MENEDKTPEETTPPENRPDSFEEQIGQLADNLNRFSSEMETIKSNLKKRKSETTTIKVLLYTGLLVLFVGFLYTTSTLQRAQLRNMESNIASLQVLMNQELLLAEKKLYEEIQRLEDLLPGVSGGTLEEILNRMNTSLSRIEPQKESAIPLIAQLKKDSDELHLVYEEYLEQRMGNSAGE